MQYNPTLHKLSNGVTVILDPMDLETTAVRVSFSTGSRDELPHEYGLTHFCEHMLCKGTPRFPNKRAIDDYMDYHGGTRNASTGRSSLSFFGRILAQNVNILIDYIGDQIQNSLFEPAKIEIERSVICDELRRALDNPSRQFSDFMSSQVFGNSTFSTLNLGTLETINSFTRDQMLEFLSRRLSAKNCIIGVSGRILDSASVLEQLEKSFSFLPTHDVSENTYIPYSPGIYHNSQPDKKNVQLCILFPEIWPADFAHYYNNISVGRFERYMNKQIADVLRQDNGLVYGFSGFDIGNEHHGWNGFITETSASNISQVVALIAQNAYRIYNTPDITSDDLDRYNRKDALGDADWLESSTRRCDKLMGFYRTHGRIYDFYWANSQFNKITVADTIENSRGYFSGPMSIITQGADFEADLRAIWDENLK
ncbi:MAG: insulinase family protein [Alphaproteobacteria bacterium]|nr:insulinase family protein [Alphaproteobacteria bacterium]